MVVEKGDESMKLTGIVLVIICSLGLIWSTVAEVLADYEFENQLGSYWSLSVKASTLDGKAQYLNQFVKAIEDAKLSGHNAVWLKTPDNDIEQNMVTLKTLQTRMNEIKGMDVTSFAYQQAIQQITAQEQDEATKLLGVISGVWYLNRHPLIWEWIDLLKWMFLAVGIMFGIFLIVWVSGR